METFLKAILIVGIVILLIGFFPVLLTIVKFLLGLVVTLVTSLWFWAIIGAIVVLKWLFS